MIELLIPTHFDNRSQVIEHLENYINAHDIDVVVIGEVHGRTNSSLIMSELSTRLHLDGERIYFGFENISDENFQLAPKDTRQQYMDALLETHDWNCTNRQYCDGRQSLAWYHAYVNSYDITESPIQDIVMMLDGESEFDENKKMLRMSSNIMQSFRPSDGIFLAILGNVWSTSIDKSVCIQLRNNGYRVLCLDTISRSFSDCDYQTSRWTIGSPYYMRTVMRRGEPTDFVLMADCDARSEPAVRSLNR